ncbi:MAG TPA: PH domain-containing protein [Candidatus Saccharimonadales bacterium]|nr:PH domain-containing protein [Candidatus Saccharimonadales bacterium]
MNSDDKIHNPVEEYMKHLMERDKPDKPPETITEPTKHLEVKMDRGEEHGAFNSSGGSRQEALKVADAIKQSVNLKRSSKEEHIFNIRRHPMGIILAFLAVIIGYAVVFSVIGFLLPGFADLTGSELSSIGLLAGISMLAVFSIGLMYLLFKARSYMLHRLILTDLNIIHILHTGILDKKITKLPVADVENVKIQKTGLFSSIFNYGTIIIETIEGQNNFTFKYAPYPDIHAKAVNDCKLEYLASHKIASL